MTMFPVSQRHKRIELQNGTEDETKRDETSGSRRWLRKIRQVRQNGGASRLRDRITGYVGKSERDSMVHVLGTAAEMLWGPIGCRARGPVFRC